MTAHLILASDAVAVRNGLKTLVTSPPLSCLAEDERGTAEVVLAEALNNIVEHAYAATSGVIEVRLATLSVGIACQITDSGAAMPGSVLPAGVLPDMANRSLEDLAEGGFGWFLIRSLTTDLCYRRDGPMNRLSFTLPRAQVSA